MRRIFSCVGNPESLQVLVSDVLSHIPAHVWRYIPSFEHTSSSIVLPFFIALSHSFNLVVTMGSLILALSLLSLADVLVVGDPIHVPVRRVRSGQKTDLNEIARRVKVKYGFPDTLPSRRSRRASSASIPTVDQVIYSAHRCLHMSKSQWHLHTRTAIPAILQAWRSAHRKFPHIKSVRLTHCHEPLEYVDLKIWV